MTLESRFAQSFTLCVITISILPLSGYGNFINLWGGNLVILNALSVEVLYRERMIWTY